MNVDPILLGAVKKAAADYRAGALDQTAMKARAARVSELRRRSGVIERRKDQIRKIFAKHDRAMGRVVAALVAGKTLVAIDVGYTEACPIEEVGITTLDGDIATTVNYIVEGQESRRAGIPCIYGTTEVKPLDEVLRLTQAAYDAAGIGIFHAAHIDVAALGLDVSKTYYVDTCTMALRWHPESQSLDSLCDRYGISNDGAHNSGNDSRRTLEVLLAQAEDKTPPYFRFGGVI
jgi:hypothetical protein